MATNIGNSLGEGQSTNRPPSFNGTNYNYWKNRMRIYVQSVDYDLWRIIVNGPKTPTIKIEGVDTPKPESTWDKNDLKMLQRTLRL